MADSLTVTIEDTASPEFDQVAELIAVYTLAAAEITADRIASEARGRIRRRTGQTAEAITVEDAYRGDGYVVLVGRRRHHVGRYLEYGTRFMRPRPFLHASARLEEAAHDRRLREAIQAAIDEAGLGDAGGAAA